MTVIDRRTFLGSAAAATMLGACAPLAAARADTDRNFLFVIQRGAADGLATVAPTGSPHLEAARPTLIEVMQGGLRLDPLFTLHPSLAELGGLYGRGEALFAHAVATSYRDRSHFDGQNMLETAGPSPYRIDSGWLNRFVSLLPGGEGFALSQTIPTVLRGTAPVSSYAPSTLPEANQDLLARVALLYDGDAELHAQWNEAVETQALAGTIEGNIAGGAALGVIAARLMAEPDGPRILVVETGGWDTHFGQNPKLAAQLAKLDGLIGAFRDGMEGAWPRTMIAVATEFGRTVAQNGTGGTDHGTGSAAILAGGAVRGGRVVSDWPDIAPGRLYQDRDLRPTMALDGLIGGALAEHFAIDPERLERTVFPTVTQPEMISNLIRA